MSKLQTVVFLGCINIAMALASPGPAMGQRVSDLSQGIRMRVILRDGTTAVGKFGGIASDTLRLIAEDSVQYTYRLADTKSIEIAAGKNHAGGFLPGAGIGAAIGLVVGGIIGATASVPPCQPLPYLGCLGQQPSSGEKAGIGAAGGTILGFVFGGAIGRIRGVDGWHLIESR